MRRCAVLRAQLAATAKPHSSVVSPVGKFTLSKVEKAGRDNAPVVFLFGWVEARDRGLAKYGDIFHDTLGAENVYRHIAPTWDGFFSPKKLEETTREMLSIIQKRHVNTPVIINYFSNGGCWHHEHLIRIMEEEKEAFKNVDIRAFIYDSAPALLTTDACAQAITSFIKDARLRKLAYLATWPLYFAFSPLINGYGLNRKGRYFEALIERDRTHLRGQKHLFIYSKTDGITEYEGLMDFIRARRRRIRRDGVDPKAVIYEADMNDENPSLVSPHVTHYLVQPEKYKKAIATFLERDVGLDLPRLR